MEAGWPRLPSTLGKSKVEIIHQGDVAAIFAIADHRNRAESDPEDSLCYLATDFLDSLEDQALAQFEVRFKALGSQGKLSTPTQFNRLQVPGTPPIWEIKVENGPGFRLYIVRQGNTIYATHGTKKPKPRRVPTEVQIARKIWEEWKR